MSQNREQARDRLHGESDFRTNVKAQTLMEHLTVRIEESKPLFEQRGAPPG
jgi:uncharacterized membrane protein